MMNLMMPLMNLDDLMNSYRFTGFENDPTENTLKNAQHSGTGICLFLEMSFSTNELLAFFGGPCLRKHVPGRPILCARVLSSDGGHPANVGV